MWALIPQHRHGHHEEDIQYHIRNHGDDADTHGCTGILLGVKTRGQHLYHNKTDQTERKCRQTQGGHTDVMAIKFAVLKQGNQQWARQQYQSERGRHADDQHHAQGPIQRV